MTIYYDLRSLSSNAVSERLRSQPLDCGFIMTAWQAAAVRNVPADVIVTVPDFLNYARLLNTGQAGTMVRLSGSIVSSGIAGIVSSPAIMRSPLRTAAMDFWVIAETLLRYDMALLPSNLRATVMLHSYLADFSFVFDREQLVRTFAGMASKRGSFGIHTQQLPKATSCLARWDVIPNRLGYLFSPGNVQQETIIEAIRSNETFSKTRMVAEAESLPRDVQLQLVEADTRLFNQDVSVSSF